MSIPPYLAFTVVAGCIATIVAAVAGVSRALQRSDWSDRERRRAVRTVASLLAGWFALAVTLAIVGVYSAAASRIPTIQFGIVIPIFLGGLMIWRWPAVSRLIDAVPRQWVIAIQCYRVEGVTFLVLYAAHLLPGLFAIPAGVGDVSVGIAAAGIGFGAIGRRPLRASTVLRWNLLGIADLVVAITTGFLTSPSSFQIFAFDRPNELISVFPLVLIPTFLVPLAILLHMISLIQLRRATAHASGSREGAVRHVPA
jgi:predicted membrane channel-forming protein YqfA (hemolysin III family)